MSRFGAFIGADRSIQVSNSILNYPFLWKYLLVATVLTGLFSGLYPALYLSSLRPIRALRGSQAAGRKKRRGAKALIVVQFTLSVLFIALALIYLGWSKVLQTGLVFLTPVPSLTL